MKKSTFVRMNLGSHVSIVATSNYNGYGYKCTFVGLGFRVKETFCFFQGVQCSFRYAYF